jgi:hypothetical protein
MAWYVAIALDDPFFVLSLSPSDDRAEIHPGLKAPGLQTEDAGAPARADLPATPVDGGVFDAPGRYGRRRACCRMVWPSRFSTFSVVHMMSAPSSSLCHSFSWFSSHRNCLFTASADGRGDALPFQPVSILSADQLPTTAPGESAEIVFFFDASHSVLFSEAVLSGDRIALDDVPDLSSAISPGIW